MEHVVQEAVCDVMRCEVKWSRLEKSDAWIFWSKPRQGLEYQGMLVDFRSSISSLLSNSWCPFVCLLQVWVPIKVNGSTFLSVGDQPFILYRELDERLSSYRRLCLDNYKEGPPARVLTTHMPEYNPDIRSYSDVEFPLRQSAIQLGIHSYYAFPLFHLHDHQCVGVFEFVSTDPVACLPWFIRSCNFKPCELYCIFNSRDKFFRSSERPIPDRLDKIKEGLYKILQKHRLPFAQIWIPYSRSDSVKVLYCADDYIYEDLVYVDFKDVSKVCTIESGKALVGRAFASHGSCFCKDVTLLSINDYPLVPSARKARFTRSFAICLRSKFANNIIYIVEYFLPPNEMVLSDTKTFLNMLLSTMQQLLPGFVVASGKELGQRMPVEVVKVPPTNEFDSFELANLCRVFRNATTNNEKIHSHKNNSIQRIEKDHRITREILEQHFGMTLKDAAENLQVSRTTLKRISRKYDISRWPHHKTRKVNVHVSQGASFQGAEPYVSDQQCPALSQREKGTDSLDHKRSPASRVPSDSLMTLKVTYRDDIIKFQLSLSSTRVELEGEVEKRLKISLERFSIKYEDEDNDWILITSDSDLRDGMHSLMALEKTTMRLLVTPKAAT